MDREKVINELVEHIESALDVDSDYVDCVRTDLLQTVVGLLKEQEAVVRCKDCKYSASDMACTHPNEWGNEVSRNDGNPDWFCADGERKK